MINNVVTRWVRLFQAGLTRGTSGSLLHRHRNCTILKIVSNGTIIGDQARCGKPQKRAFPEGSAVFGSVLSKFASLVVCYRGFLAFHPPSSQPSLAEGHSSAR